MLGTHALPGYLTARESNRSGSDGEASPDADAEFTPLVCVANIGPQQRRIRLNFGLRMFALSLAGLAALLLVHADVWWRLLLFLPFATAGAGYFQARDHT